MGTFVNHFNWLSGSFFVMTLKYGQGVPIFQGDFFFYFFVFWGYAGALEPSMGTFRTTSIGGCV